MNNSIFKLNSKYSSDLLSIVAAIIFSVIILSLKFNYSDNERAIAALTKNNYSEIKNLDVGNYSNCAFKWYSKSVVGQTKFTAKKNGITYKGTVCLVFLGDDKIVLN